jgi:hypothetical protein
VHGFPFSLKIPFTPSLPGSFDTPLGQILYQIVAYHDFGFGKLERRFEKIIRVLSYLNLLCLQNLPSLQWPVCCEKAENPNNSLLSGQRRESHQTGHHDEILKFSFRIPHSSYVAGEEIPFEFEIDNPSSYQIERMSLFLIQKINYNATCSGLSKFMKNLVTTKEKTDEMDTPYWTLWKDSLIIPHSKKPSQTGIIEISYVIRVISD